MDKYSLLEKFFSGQSTEEENNVLSKIFKDGGEDIFDEYCRRKWAENDCRIPTSVKARIRQSLFTKMPRVKWRRVIASASAVLAAAVILFMCMLWSRPSENAAPEIFEIVAERGQKSSVTLPDGSRVMINSASTISYTSDYNVKERNVFLSGEAYFDVASNADIPFVVHADKVSVTALGTEFNVKAYAEDPYVVTTLVEGSVRTEAGTQYELLTRAQEASYNKEADVLLAYDVKDISRAVPWIRNELLFENESLADIAVTLERMYNVTIVFEDEAAKGYSYTGLIRNNSLQNVLELISSTSPVGYKMNSGIIRFYMKH
jgi:ferric-dicitrate binding protein FerR (iron transport regulator)